jgi:hypothetical protein
VFADHGVIGKASNGYSFRLVEVERLRPVSGEAVPARPAARRRLLGRLRKWANMGVNRGRLALYHIAQEPPPELPASLVEAVARLSDFIEGYPVQPDILNPDNLMMRADGTLVFADPVFLPLTASSAGAVQQRALGAFLVSSFQATPNTSSPRETALRGRASRSFDGMAAARSQVVPER